MISEEPMHALFITLIITIPLAAMNNTFTVCVCVICNMYVYAAISLISLDKAVEVTHITAQVGDNVELKCDVTGIPPMRFVWKRYEVDLASQDDHQIRVFSDGTLYLSNIQLLHSGNYTCHGERNSHVVQTHVLTVQGLSEKGTLYPCIHKSAPSVPSLFFLTHINMHTCVRNRILRRF